MDTLRTLALVAKHFPQASAAVALAFLSDLEERVEDVSYDLNTFRGQVGFCRSLTVANGCEWNFWDRKIQAIREIRVVSNLGLREAKDVVDSAIALHNREEGKWVTNEDSIALERYGNDEALAALRAKLSGGGDWQNDYDEYNAEPPF